jgi:hypothetical protein
MRSSTSSSLVIFAFNNGANRHLWDSGKNSSLSRGYFREYYFPFRLSSDVRHTGRARLLLRSRLSAAASKLTGTHKSSVDGSLFIFQISRDLVYTCSADLTGQINTSERSFAPPQPSPRNTAVSYFLSTRPTAKKYTSIVSRPFIFTCPS